MPTDTLRLGAELSVTTLCDAAGVFPEPLEDAFPSLETSGHWSMHVHCQLVRAGSRVVLIDTGIGPPWAPAGGWFARPAALPEELAALGVDPKEITDVVLTHLHPDHLGWNVLGEDEVLPHFPNARHVVQAAELAWLREHGSEWEELYETHVVPLVESDLLVEVDGPTRLMDRIELILAPGHTPGHQCVLIDAPDRPLLVTGDAFVHTGQIEDPSLGYRYEREPEEAETTRRRLLSVAAQRGVLLAPAHLDDGILLVESAGKGRFRTTSMTRCPRFNG
ncbi:MAG TPA: MBL fold metallo-hydrolase [Cryptosporangiaceae bacterium]|nr:MBL fold metallo-hydrolase [Cryptosporangiaceae bacterium]